MTWSLRQLLGASGSLLPCFGMVLLVGCEDSGPDDRAGGGAGLSTGGATGGSSMGGSGAGVGGSTGGTGVSGMTGSGGTGVSGMTGAGGAAGTGGTGMAGTGGAAATGGASGGGGRVDAGGSAGRADGGAAGRGLGGSAGVPSGGLGGAEGGTAGAGAVSGAGGGSAGMANDCPPGTPLTGGKQYCSNSKGSAGGGYAYELWAEGAGSGCMTVFGADANFKANWNGVEDFLARIGLDFDQSKTHAQLGTFSADFAETKTGGSDGLVYVGIYGWTVSPLREYYILDDWGTTKPAGTASDGTPREYIGTFMVDGDNYDVYKKTRMNKPAITGDNMTFDQYFSIRQHARQCGHISISAHFEQWETYGLDLGKLYESKLLLEAQDSTGTIEFTTAKLQVD